MRRDDDRLAFGQAVLDDPRLHQRQDVIVDLDPQIAARDHDGVGDFDDPLEISQPRLVFDLGDDARLGAEAVEQARSTRMSSLRRTNESATKSIPAATPARMSRSSFSVSDGRFTSTPGRLMCRREPSLPGVSTRQRTCVASFSTTSRRISPLSTSTVAPTATSAGRPG